MTTTDAAGTTAERLGRVRDRIATAAATADRAVDDVRLVAVTKTHPPAAVVDLLDHGLVDVGENRVGELVAKRHHVDDDRARWHLIGGLQRNKVNDVAGTGALIHTVDRRSVVDAIARHCRATGTTQRVLVQVNVADDPAKRGCHLAEVDDLVAYSAAKSELTVEGLMTMPPLPSDDEDPNDAARPHFARLRAARDRLVDEHPDCRELSMGMSQDLEAAVVEGSTMVRVGTALLGPRQPGPWEPLW